MATVQKRKRGEKAAFIRQHPNLPAKDVIELAKKAGIKLTAMAIYNCRAVDKKKKGKSSRRKSPAAHAAQNGADLSNQLVVVAGVVKKLGGVENVRQALKLIEQVSGALN